MSTSNSELVLDKPAQETLALIKQRISANKFDPTRSLSKEEIEELVEYAAQAPSSMNLQNWRFVAVTDLAAKEKLKSVAFNQQKIADASVTFIVLGDLEGHEHLATALEPAVEQGIMPKQLAEAWVTGAQRKFTGNDQHKRDEAIRSASLAAMTLMLAASAKGLVSGPVGGFDPEGVKREFGISDRYLPVMLLPVGYEAPGNWPRKPRFKHHRILAFNQGAEL